MPLAEYLVIGGAEKAGTTSLFSYLAAHPGVCASSEKETDYFRADVQDLMRYQSYFRPAQPEQRLFVEASPGYLAEAEQVAPRFAALLPDARHVFILRDPLDRLVSSYRFYQSRLHLPPAMDFDGFVRACLNHAQGCASPHLAGIKAWHLNALDRGRYERHLIHFRQVLAAGNMLVLSYDDLRKDVRATMKQVAAFAGLDAAFYDGYEFQRENVSFVARRRGVQRLAVMANDSLQGFWRRHPRLKHRLLRTYKAWNADPPQPESMHADTRKRLLAYYLPTYEYLRSAPATTA